MFTARWQPLAEISQLRSEMERLFGRYGIENGQSRSTFPVLNMWEDENSLVVETELPGFQLENLEMYVTGGNQLSIKGSRNQPEMGEGTWHRQERGFGAFNRVIELPHVVESENVSATFEDGVLRIALPKSEAAKPRRIAVTAK